MTSAKKVHPTPWSRKAVLDAISTGCNSKLEIRRNVALRTEVIEITLRELYYNGQIEKARDGTHVLYFIAGAEQ